jgi:hypothetical protein
METATVALVVNVAITVLIAIGVYKQKIDAQGKILHQYRDLETRIVRLEEKINFIINNLKK